MFSGCVEIARNKCFNGEVASLEAAFESLTCVT